MQLGYLAILSETRFPLGLPALFLGPVFIFKGAEEGGGGGGGAHQTKGCSLQRPKETGGKRGSIRRKYKT